MAATAPLRSMPAGSLAELLEDQILETQAALLELARDPEGVVHDARVALRKLRSSLSIFSPLLVLAAARPLRRELTWLAGELGPARDAQVMLARMSSAVADQGIDAEERDAVLSHFQTRYDEGFARARNALASERFIAILGRLDVARLRTLVASQAPFADLAGQDLDRLVQDLEQGGRDSDVQLHELRKAVKRARYVRHTHDKVDSALKRVQGVLGEHQDSVVARQLLGQLPATPLIESLVARESALGTNSANQLHKSVQKLNSALVKSSVAR